MKRFAFLATVACLCGCALPGTGRAGMLTLEYTVVVTNASGTVLGTQTTGPQSGTSPVTFGVAGTVGDIVFPASGAATASDGSLNFAINPIKSQSASTTETAHVVVSATGFTTPTPGTAALDSVGLFLGMGSAITAKWYEDPNNAGLSTVTGTTGMNDTTFNIFGSQVGMTNSFTAPDNGFDNFDFHQPGLSLPSNTPYGMTLAFDLTLTPGASLEDFGQTESVAPATTSAVPEPAPLTLLGIGVAGLLGYGWRRKRAA